MVSLKSFLLNITKERTKESTKRKFFKDIDKKNGVRNFINIVKPDLTDDVKDLDDCEVLDEQNSDIEEIKKDLKKIKKLIKKQDAFQQDTTISRKPKKPKPKPEDKPKPKPKPKKPKKPDEKSSILEFLKDVFSVGAGAAIATRVKNNKVASKAVSITSSVTKSTTKIATKAITKLGAPVAAGVAAYNFFNAGSTEERVKSVTNGTGAIIGGALGSFIPIPVVGTLVGAAAGAIVGDLVGDFFTDVDDKIPDEIKKDPNLYLKTINAEIEKHKNSNITDEESQNKLRILRARKMEIIKSIKSKTVRGAVNEKLGGSKINKVDVKDVFKLYKTKESDVKHLQPKVYENLMYMGVSYKQLTGEKMQINSAFRSPEEQRKLKERYGNRAAAPGKSMHNFGYAVDINTKDLNTAHKAGILQASGFVRPIKGETWHIEPKGINRAAIRSGQTKVETEGVSTPKLLNKNSVNMTELNKIKNENTINNITQTQQQPVVINNQQQKPVVDKGITLKDFHKDNIDIITKEILGGY